MSHEYAVSVSSGSLAHDHTGSVRLPHRWTEHGVVVHTEFTGAHLLHVAVAGCVLNDVHREAATLGLTVDGVRVTASGGFDTDSWATTGIDYVVEVSGLDGHDLDRLLDRVDDVAEIPRAVRAGGPVRRVDPVGG